MDGKVRTLCNDAPNHAHSSQLSTSSMRIVWPRLVQVGPAQKTPGPVPLARFVALAELVEVDGLVRLVQRIRPIGAAIVSQARCYRYARTGEQQRLAMLVHALCRRRELRRDARLRDGRVWQTRREKLEQRVNGAARRLCAGGDYFGQGQGARVGNAQEGHCASSEKSTRPPSYVLIHHGPLHTTGTDAQRRDARMNLSLGGPI
jgi:hypothetical protein